MPEHFPKQSWFAVSGHYKEYKVLKYKFNGDLWFLFSLKMKN